MERSFVTNKHLKISVQEFKKYIDMNEEPPHELFVELMNELKVSNLLIPGLIEEDSLNFENLTSEEDDLTVLPLFTDDEEFIKENGEDYEFDPIACDFDYYIELIENISIDGILINSASEEFIVETEVILEYPFAELPDVDESVEGYDAKRLLEVANNPENDSIEKFIKSKDTQFEAIMLELEKSCLLNAVIAPESLDEYAKDGIIDADDVDGFDVFTVEKDGGEYGILFTSMDAIRQSKGDDANCYCQVALIDEFFEYVLYEDMDGIIINPGLDDYVIPRTYILEAYGAMTYSKPEFKDAMDYTFML